MYVKVANGAVEQFPYTLGNLRRDNPNTSFPKNPSDEMLVDWGVYPVSTTDQPSFDVKTQNVSQDDSPTLNGAAWELGWTVSNKTADEVTSYNNQIAERNRITRDKLLADSDWTQMNDSPLSNEDKTAWATYRQELRDLSDLDAWPNLADEDWPVEP